MRKTRVLIIDDSALVRAVLQSSLSRHPDIEIVGLAADGNEGIHMLQTLRPDVATLDVEMPNMNGLEVLDRVAGKLPVAFVMCSTLTQRGGQITLDALQRGAVDYITKPTSGVARDQSFHRDLYDKVITASKSKGRVRALQRTPVASRSSAPSLPPNQARGWIVGIAISCGGPQTLHKMLPAFPSDFVPILVTQHMPAQFTRAFAGQLDRVCAMKVVEAGDGQPISQGTVYIAPGSHHLTVARRGVGLVCKLDASAPVNGHRPAADVMFASMARVCAGRCVGIVMTGMGVDGATGITALHSAGAPTLAQDEATSLVYGMPKAAAATNCIDKVCSLGNLPTATAKVLSSGRSRTLARS